MLEIAATVAGLLVLVVFAIILYGFMRSGALRREKEEQRKFDAAVSRAEAGRYKSQPPTERK